ncbi:HAD family hydrolase [Trichothermofontia sp.]
MSIPPPTLLALDFDGVLCDGRREYFQSAWRAYGQIWADAAPLPPPHLEQPFYRLRPVVETGWEMPLLLRAMHLDYAEAQLLQDWTTIAPQLLAREGLTQSELQTALDSQRDQWIQTDLTGWLQLHDFYPGTIARLQAAIAEAVPVVIITTKESRFVKQLLQQAGISPPLPQIFGREQQRPKREILRSLQSGDPRVSSHPPSPSIWFVEDRLKTLQNVQQHPDLAKVALFLADWGYNTAAERAQAQQDHRISPLSLEQFGQPFPAWYRDAPSSAQSP